MKRIGILALFVVVFALVMAGNQSLADNEAIEMLHIPGQMSLPESLNDPLMIQWQEAGFATTKEGTGTLEGYTIATFQFEQYNIKAYYKQSSGEIAGKFNPSLFGVLPGINKTTFNATYNKSQKIVSFNISQHFEDGENRVEMQDVYKADGHYYFMRIIQTPTSDYYYLFSDIETNLQRGSLSFPFQIPEKEWILYIAEDTELKSMEKDPSFEYGYKLAEVVIDGLVLEDEHTENIATDAKTWKNTEDEKTNPNDDSGINMTESGIPEEKPEEKSQNADLSASNDSGEDIRFLDHLSAEELQELKSWLTIEKISRLSNEVEHRIEKGAPARQEEKTGKAKVYITPENFRQYFYLDAEIQNVTDTSKRVGAANFNTVSGDLVLTGYPLVSCEIYNVHIGVEVLYNKGWAVNYTGSSSESFSVQIPADGRISATKHFSTTANRWSIGCTNHSAWFEFDFRGWDGERNHNGGVTEASGYILVDAEYVK